MSDNIDYDELDKAVNAAISARNAANAQPKPTLEPKPAKPSDADKKPAAKPARRGIVMDFSPRHSTVKTAPAVHSTIAKKVAAPKPVAPKIAAPTRKTTEPIIRNQPIRKPIAAPVKRLVERPAVKPVAKTIAKPTVPPARVASKAILKPVAKPIAKPAPKEAPKPVVKEKPVLEEKPAPILKKREAPNANNFSIGGRSPFVKNTKVEKRPLGKNIPETSATTLRSTHNIYSQKSPIRTTENIKKHVITQEPQKKSGWLWTLVVLGIILAGGAIGYFCYLLVFAN